jgi:hypothetical protein
MSKSPANAEATPQYLSPAAKYRPQISNLKCGLPHWQKNQIGPEEELARRPTADKQELNATIASGRNLNQNDVTDSRAVTISLLHLSSPNRRRSI